MKSAIIFAVILGTLLCSTTRAITNKDRYCKLCINAVKKARDMFKKGLPVEKTMNETVTKYCTKGEPKWILPACKAVKENPKLLSETLRNNESPEKFCSFVQI
ncbi:hypothetical protein GCK32_020525, partial [Trichostrongylus colubriformis]